MFTLKQKLNRLAISISFAMGFVINLAIVTPAIADESTTDDLAIEVIAESLDHP